MKTQNVLKRGEKMKIVINETKINGLKELKENIEELFESYVDNMEFTEENLKKISELVDKVNSSGLKQFNYGLMKVEIVSSDGTKLTIM